jgi:hypothetical protein
MGGVAFIGIVYLLIAALKELVSKESRFVVLKHTLRVITTMFVVFALSSLGKSATTQEVIIIDRKDSGASYTTQCQVIPARTPRSIVVAPPTWRIATPLAQP